MSLSLIDGSNGNIDLSIAGNSYKGILGYFTANVSRSFMNYTTFSSGGWIEERPGQKQLTGRGDGYIPKGVTQADPSILISSTATQAYVLTFETGCTATFSGHCGNFQLGVQAMAGTQFSIDFRSSGAVTFAWVVT